MRRRHAASIAVPLGVALCVAGLVLLGACRPTASVEESCDCQRLERCVHGECLPINCDESAGCPLGSTCADSVCRERTCEDDADCPGGRCVDGGCYSIQCVEDETQSCENACGAGTEKCINGVWRGCDAPQPDDERCGDGADNDCDGDIDEGCSGCAEGSSRPCSTECGEGVELCVDAAYQTCDAPQPVAEICDDGADNDCDGDVDEDCAACPGDSLEDNNDRDSATPLGAGSYPGLGICPGDEDWYGVTLDVGQGLEARITFADADGDIDLKIEDAYGLPVDSSLSVGDEETAAVPNVSLGGPFFLRVYGFGGAVDNGYSMELVVQDPGTCVDDRHEDNDAHAQAKALSSSGRVNERYLRVCAGDEDWYRVYLSSGELLRVELRFTHALGDLDLAVYDADEARLDGSLTTTDDEQVELTAAAAGYHYIKVYGFQTAENNYQLIVDVP